MKKGNEGPPTHHEIGVTVNKAVTADVHNNGQQREAAIKRLVELLAIGGTSAIDVFVEIQKGK